MVSWADAHGELINNFNRHAAVGGSLIPMDLSSAKSYLSQVKVARLVRGKTSFSIDRPQSAASQISAITPRARRVKIDCYLAYAAGACTHVRGPSCGTLSMSIHSPAYSTMPMDGDRGPSNVETQSGVDRGDVCGCVVTMASIACCRSPRGPICMRGDG